MCNGADRRCIRLKTTSPTKDVVVTLRPLTVADVTDRYVQWLNDPEVTRYLIAGRTAQTRESIVAFVRGIPATDRYAVEVDGQHVGNVCFRHVDAASRVAEVGLLIGDRARWGHGIGTAAVRELMERARARGYAKLWAGTCNPACGVVFHRCGWIGEGVQRRQVFLSGGWHDHALFAWWPFGGVVTGARSSGRSGGQADRVASIVVRHG